MAKDRNAWRNNNQAKNCGWRDAISCGVEWRIQRREYLGSNGLP